MFAKNSKSKCLKGPSGKFNYRWLERTAGIKSFFSYWLWKISENAALAELLIFEEPSADLEIKSVQFPEIWIRDRQA